LALFAPARPDPRLPSSIPPGRASDDGQRPAGSPSAAGGGGNLNLGTGNSGNSEPPAAGPAAVLSPEPRNPIQGGGRRCRRNRARFAPPGYRVNPGRAPIFYEKKETFFYSASRTRASVHERGPPERTKLEAVRVSGFSGFRGSGVPGFRGLGCRMLDASLAEAHGGRKCPTGVEPPNPRIPNLGTAEPRNLETREPHPARRAQPSIFVDSRSSTSRPPSQQCGEFVRCESRFPD
jgi:hypothetical protein